MKTLKEMGVGNSVLDEPYPDPQVARLTEFIERLHYELKQNGYMFWARKCELILGRSLDESYNRYAKEYGEESS